MACSETGATTTAAPDFGYALAARTIGTAESLDLGRLRTCICGGEVVRWSTLKRFAEACAAAGFRPRAFCPAYGLAEATLAVTMVRPEQDVTVRNADAAALADGEWRDMSAGQGQSVVSRRLLAWHGLPYRGGKLRAGSDRGDGPLHAFRVRVAGPQLDSGGWLRTGDLGIFIDGELYPTGRYDDWIIVAGRNVDAMQLEGSIGGKGGIRYGGAAAVEDGDGGFAVVAETAEVSDPRQIADAVRDMLVRATGLAPSAIIFVPRGRCLRRPAGSCSATASGACFTMGSWS